jgi:hypothetical protein
MSDNAPSWPSPPFPRPHWQSILYSLKIYHLLTMIIKVGLRPFHSVINKNHYKLSNHAHGQTNANLKQSCKPSH